MTNQKEFIAGAAGGLAGVVTGYPFDTVKGKGFFLKIGEKVGEFTFLVCS